MTEEELLARFPKMRPIGKPPSMHLINGIGTRVYGERDRDVESGAFVTTLCFCVLWIPLFCLKSYRVIKANNGWYFLGREPMSTVAKTWNAIAVILIATAAGGIGLGVYMGTPEYKARQRMSEARGMVEKGEAGSGAVVYAQLASAGKEQSSEAVRALRGLVEQEGKRAPLPEVAVMFREAARVATRSDALTAAELVSAGMGILKERGEKEPKGALGLLEVLRPLALDTREIDAARLPLLKKWVAEEPAMEAVVALAELLMEGNDVAGAKAVLSPLRGQVGDGEGARVLGLICAREGDYEQAGRLLAGYVKPRVERLHAAEKAAEATEERLWQQEVTQLKENKGPPELYARMDKATPEEQGRLVRDYLQGKLKGHPELMAAQDRLAQDARVVPVTMELGIVLLQGAQGIHDPAKRKAQLEGAQEAFLSIKGFAGESDAYKMFLAQVYYWLGKQEEGRKLFDEMLAGQGRSAQALLRVAATLRELGVDQEARALTEEAFTKATASEERYFAAQLRSAMFKDADDQVAWLEKADPKEPMVRANLSLARGHQAAWQGRQEEAIVQYRTAAEVYGAMPRGSSTLNQAALAYSALYQLTGEEKDGARCLDCIQQAVELEPSDPILLYNSAAIVLQATYRAIEGPQLDMKLLQQGGNSGLLRFLHHDEAGREAMVKAVAEHPGTQRAVGYGERCMVISPKHKRSYEVVNHLRSLMRDEAGLRALLEKVRAAGIDETEDVEQLREVLAKKDEEKQREANAAALGRARERSKAARAAGGATAAAALVHEAQLLETQDLYTRATDADEVVRLCEEAQAMAPSLGTMSELTSAYLFKTAKTLRKDPAFEALYQQHVRLLGCDRLMTVVATEPGPFHAAALAEPAFEKAVDSVVGLRKTYTSWARGQEWLLLKERRPAEAARLAELIRKAPWALAEAEVDAALAPASPGEAIDLYWARLAVGNEGEAKQGLAHVRELGLPLPIAR